MLSWRFLANLENFQTNITSKGFGLLFEIFIIFMNSGRVFAFFPLIASSMNNDINVKWICLFLGNKKSSKMRIHLAPPVRFEPTTLRLTAACYTGQANDNYTFFVYLHQTLSFNLWYVTVSHALPWGMITYLKICLSINLLFKVLRKIADNLYQTRYSHYILYWLLLFLWAGKLSLYILR